MSRYELIRLGQLIFSLVLMFGAFLGGLAVGWWRWGRPRSTPNRPEPFIALPRRHVSHDLFTPAEMAPEERPEPVASGSAFSAGRRELEASVDPFNN